MKYCPMKFMNTNQLLQLINSIGEKMSYEIVLGCNKNQCAWYCQYPNGKGECAIHSLPGLFDELDSIATQIATK